VPHSLGSPFLHREGGQGVRLLFFMITVTPEVQLRTMFVLDGRGRIGSSPEPSVPPAPLFALIRGVSSCAWAMRADVPETVAAEIERLAGQEPPLADLEDPQDAPLNADVYLALLGGRIVSGPAFTFPERIAHHHSNDVALIDRLELLERNFRGWVAAEIPWRAPIVAVMDCGYPVSVCFCATRASENTVEAGLETAPAFRGRGFAPRVTAAWATAIRASGRIPLYSTSWTNSASRAVARKLGLLQYAVDWTIVERATKPQA
jgi:RimJ/RimL family protein N-acetyltransferase